MNRYGEIARQHWQQWLPKRYRALENPTQFFTNLGEEISTRIHEVSQALAGEDPPAEQYLQKLGRLNMARANAESQVLRELALLEPEKP
jgi:hypothetical protein